MSLWKLFKLFLRPGATGFGGAMSLISLVQQEVVERRKLIEPEAFAEGLAVSQLLPGPIAVDVVTYIGYRLRGILGAIVSTAALILPAFILMLVLTPLYLAYHHLPALEGAFKGIGAVVVAVIAVATINIGKGSLKNWGQAAFAVVAFVALVWLKLNPIAIILAAGFVGMLFWRPVREAGQDE